MSFRPQVSLVIVSRGRPEGLRRLVSSLRFQSHPNYEVVVVSDDPNTGFLGDLPGAPNIRHVHFNEANISAARNIGISNSAADIIAFCDDDAVPEPFWLERLVAPFEDQRVGSTGGFVRGRNGIDFQWTATKCDECGDDFPLEMESLTAPQTFAYDGTFFVKIQGTNCAFRRSALEEIAGFDEAFTFFMDETDVSFSLAKKGWKTTLVPLAEVQHGFEESAERTSERVPLTLFNISASKAWFLRKHAAKNAGASIERLRTEQRNRIIKLMVAGFLEPNNIPRLMQSFEQGLLAGRQSVDAKHFSRSKPTFVEFLPVSDRPKASFVAIFGNVATARRLSRKAMALARDGAAVTIFRYTFTSLFHKRFFDERGFWVQSGGQFGRSERAGLISQPWTSRARTVHEVENLRAQRPIEDIYSVRIFLRTASMLPKN